MAGKEFEDFAYIAKTFNVLPSSMLPELGGLAKYNLDKACAYYILIKQSGKYKDNNKKSINFGFS